MNKLNVLYVKKFQNMYAQNVKNIIANYNVIKIMVFLALKNSIKKIVRNI